MYKKCFAVVCIVSIIINLYMAYTKTIVIHDLKYLTTAIQDTFRNSPTTFNEVTLERNISNTENAAAVEFDDFVLVKEGSLLQVDPGLTKLILSRGILHPPPTAGTPYNLSTPATSDPSKGQSDVVRKIFNNMTNGFFVECGALDGETRSNTLSLERDLNWTGLLIEGGPSNFDLVQTKHRRAWTANCCLAIHPYPHKVLYQEAFNVGKISSENGANIAANALHNEGTTESVPVDCFPFLSLLSALNVTTVDYFSLDVEGHELRVLKTIPFHLVYIKVLSVEYKHVTSGKSAMKTFMESKGYRVVTRVTAYKNHANDYIFAHRNVSVTAQFPPVIKNGDRRYLYKPSFGPGKKRGKKRRVKKTLPA